MSSLEIAYPSFYDCKDDKHITEDLWYACAGSGVTIPQVGELVVYFPQGHLEQIGGAPKRLQGVPSQILCRVLNVELKSKKDFVYAWLFLEPKLSHDLEATDNVGLPPPVRRINVPYFCKKLRAAETTGHAWLSIPRKHAEKCLPALDMTQMSPVQELVVTDVSGEMWRFQHRLVKPRRHYLQAAEFVTSKNIVAGDALVILREENGELRVAVRRSTRHTRTVSSSELSNTNDLSILPSISHAVTTRSKFTVLYRPWTGTDHFIVPYKRYIESINDCCMGMRFRMIFTREATIQDRVSGIISGIEDFDTAWPGSKWKCIKVKLDKNSPTTISNGVSPWEIEPEKRSVRILDYGMKRTRSQRGLQTEQRQKTVLSYGDSSCFDREACLTNAKKVLHLYHKGSKMQDRSILENQTYVSAVDDLIYLSAGSSSGTSGGTDNVCIQAQAALDTEMSNLARTFYGLKLWNTNHFGVLDNPPCPRSLVGNLNSSLALDGPCLSSSSSEPISSGSDTGASSRDSDLIPAEGRSALHGVMSFLVEEKLELINSKSVDVVASIANRMIKAGYTDRLRDTFTDLSQVLISEFHALDFDWIFQCCSKVDEVDSSCGEDMSLQYWSSALQFITRVLVEMGRQLHEQNFGAFDALKGDYFAKIVEQPIFKLLNVAALLAFLNKLLDDVPQGSAQCLASIFLRIVNALSSYKTVADTVPTLLGLVSKECRESVSREAEAILERVGDVVSRMLDTVTNVISSSVLPETEGSVIHPITRAVTEGIVSLFQHRDILNLILAHNCHQSLQGTHSTKSFCCLISNLMMHLESVLERNSKLLVRTELQYIFLLNNLQFALQRVENSMTRAPIGYDWVVWYKKQIEHFLKQYIETSWAPVSSYVADQDGKHLSFWKPSCVKKFTEAFQFVYRDQKHWKVPDPNLRQKLRLSISNKIVPSYCGYLKKHGTDEMSLKIKGNNLEDLLAELFEG